MATDFQILSEVSVEKLRIIAKGSGYSALGNLQKLVADHELELVKSPYDFLPEVKLLIPESSSWEKNFDKENAIRVFQALPNLLPIYAADERLWVTLAYGDYFDYALKRWGADTTKSKNLTSLILNHWFCPTSRSRWRDHAISRLWWVGFIAHSVPEMDNKEVLDILYLNSDLINSLLGHPRTTSSMKVTGALLKVLHEKYVATRSIEFNRIHFRQLMHLLDLRAGKLYLDSISDSDLSSLIFDCFNESISQEAT